MAVLVLIYSRNLHKKIDSLLLRLPYRSVDRMEAGKSDVEEQIDVRGNGRIVLYKRPGLKKPKW